ncbi:MAG: cell division protein FtsL [Deltaproteobacteria bacterium]|nr:cell division protein FtsL [Deltaproteobacteria bacterium]
MKRARPKKYRYEQQSLLFRQKRHIATDKKAIARTLIHLVVFGVCVTLVALFYVWTRVEVVKLNYALGTALHEEERLHMKNERLSVELARLASPSRLSYIASEEFHLKTPKNEQIIYMND